MRKLNLDLLKKLAVIDGWENGQLTLTRSKRQSAWVAKIEGLDSKYGLKRQFLNDYEDTGRCAIWTLSDGVYCWSEKKGEQTYGLVKNGELFEITKQDAIKYFQN